MININVLISNILRKARAFANRASSSTREIKVKGDLIGISTTGTRSLTKRVYLLDYITTDPEVRRRILTGLSESAVAHLRDATDVIRRTGTMRSSFKSRMDGPYAAVAYTDQIRASGILDGLSGTRPPAQNLMDWMDSVGTFSGMDEYEKYRLAFAIRKSIETGAGRGRTGLSTLQRLPPAGTLKFNYVVVAGRQVEAEAKQVGLKLLRAL